MPEPKASKKLKKGVVKSFSEKRGVGYIKADDSDEEYLVHYSDIDLPGYAVLESGQLVEFEVDDDDECGEEQRTAQRVRPEAE